MGGSCACVCAGGAGPRALQVAHGLGRRLSPAYHAAQVSLPGEATEDLQGRVPRALAASQRETSLHLLCAEPVLCAERSVSGTSAGCEKVRVTQDDG